MFPCEDPKCGGRTRVEKPVFEDGGVWRTRYCSVCGAEFKTVEVSDTSFKNRVHQRALEIITLVKEVQDIFKRGNR